MTTSSLITSASNPKLKHLRALRQKKYRAAAGECVVEGIHHVGEAVAAGVDISGLYYAPDQLLSPFARALVDEQQARGTPCWAVAAEVFETLTDKEHPAGLLAIVRPARVMLSALAPTTFPWGVALVAPQDPGNVGTILRSMDAVNASGLLLLEGGVDPYHPSAIRASMGAIFWKPVVSASFAEFTVWAKMHHYTLYGTSARGTAHYRQMLYQHPAILVLGNEQKGLSAAQSAACDHLLQLPMRGRVSSLNVAVAAGILLYAMAEGETRSAY